MTILTSYSDTSLVFFVIMLLPLLVARIATDDGVGKHKVVTLRIKIAEIICFYGSLLASAAILILQLLGKFDYIPRELFSPIRHDMYCHEKTPYMCVWIHYAIRVLALPYNSMVSSCALPALLGLRRPRLIVYVVLVKNVLWILGVLISLYIMEISLLGVALSDLCSNFAAYVVWKRMLRKYTTFREMYRFHDSQDDRIKSPDFKTRKTRNDKKEVNGKAEDQALREGVFAQQKLVDFVVIYVEAMTDYIIRFGNNFGVTSLSWASDQLYFWLSMQPLR